MSQTKLKVNHEAHSLIGGYIHTSSDFSVEFKGRQNANFISLPSFCFPFFFFFASELFFPLFSILFRTFTPLLLVERPTCLLGSRNALLFSSKTVAKPDALLFSSFCPNSSCCRTFASFHQLFGHHLAQQQVKTVNSAFYYKWSVEKMTLSKLIPNHNNQLNISIRINRNFPYENLTFFTGKF